MFHFGISAVQILLAQREQFHQARLVEMLNPLNPTYTAGIDHLTQGLLDRGQSAANASREAVATLYGIVQQQAAMLSFIDVFHVLMIVVILAMPLLLVMQGPNGGGVKAHIE